MSLTTQDLTKLGELIDKKLEEKLDQKLDQKLAPLTRKVNRIEKKLDAAIHLFDGEVTQLKQRTTRIEKHLDLPQV